MFGIKVPGIGTGEHKLKAVTSHIPALTIYHSVMGHAENGIDLTVAVRQLETHSTTEVTDMSHQGVSDRRLDDTVLRLDSQNLFRSTETITVVRTRISFLPGVHILTE